MEKRRLGERLIQAGAITAEQLEEGLEVHERRQIPLGEALVELGHVDSDELLRILCDDAQIPYLAVERDDVDPSVLDLIPAATAHRLRALPLFETEGSLTVAFANPFDLDAVTVLERATGRMITTVGAPGRRIESLLDQLYGEEDGGRRNRGRGYGAAAISPGPRTAAPDASGTAAEIVTDLLRRGVEIGATDVHVEPAEDELGIRYRVDGLLQQGPSYPTDVHAALVARIKILAGLDIAENRLPQDGRFRTEVRGRGLDLRVSTFPTMHGEDLVLRILDREQIGRKLGTLGIAPEDVELLRKVLRRPHGLVPVTGPTGSGKTTTLYTALQELDTEERCVLTLEDPIEYELPGIRQSQINVRAGLTFASGLRSQLRHDPDVFLVGEMRDQETVQMGLSAALTGHLVLTTLHTNTAAGAIPRLLDMGAEPFILASSLEMVIAQRLVRTLCPKCKEPIDLPDEVRRRTGLEDARVFTHVGCPDCRGTGFRGRTGVFHFLPVTEAVTTAMYEGRSAEEIERLSERPTLFEDGVKKVRAGITSLDELLRVLPG